MGTCITDRDGNLASSGAGIPAFVGVLDKAVQRIIELNGEPGEIRPGDIFATNDPFHGGVTHLNDVVLAMPVFADERRIAWTANIAHWNDVGGLVPGSISNDAREIYQEGLRIPAVKLISEGQPIKSVLEIMKCNSRLRDNPEQDRGPNNASRDGTLVAAQMIFMNITDKHHAANAGNLRPLKLLTRPGSVFEPVSPAAFGTYYEVEIRLYDLLWRCLAPH